MLQALKNAFNNQAGTTKSVRQRPRVAFSCVVDQPKKFHVQSLLWFWTLKYFTGVAEEDIFIHFTPGCDEELMSYFSGLGVNVRSVPHWSDKSPPLNKLGQLSTPELKTYDYVVLSDCDKVYFDAIFDWIKGDAIKACFFVAKPPYRVFQNLYEDAGINEQRFVFRPVANDEEDPRTPPNNVNGGTYIIPSQRWERLCDEWTRMSELVLGRIKLIEKWRRNIDQVAFCMAMDSLGWDVAELPKYFDLGVNVKHPPRGIDSAFFVGAIHYHGSLDGFANIIPGEECHQTLVEKISLVNQVINRESQKTPILSKYL